MAEKMNFTQAALGKLPTPEKGRTYYRDIKMPGLTLCVWDSGVKSFELYKRMGGQPTRLKIGRFPEVTVENARKEAARLVGEIAQGKDPSEQRRKARGETAVGELFALFLEGHAKPHKRSWKGDQEQYNRYLDGWKNRKLSQVRRADVAALHAKVGRDHGTYAANRLLALLSSLFTHAARLGYEGGNPAQGVKRFKEQSRDRFLDADELKAFFVAVAAEKSETWRDFFLVALMSGARRANVLAMRWADVNLERGLWRIPESQAKSGEPLIVILPAPAVEILKRRAKGTEGDYVFPRRDGTGHVTEPKQAWARIVKASGLKDVRIHDLRRTLGSWAAAMGASLPMIGRALGHKNVATTAIYARLGLDPVRATVTGAVKAMLEAGNGDADPQQEPSPDVPS